MKLIDSLRGGAQIDARLDNLREDVNGLQAALEDRGTVETSGPDIHLSPDDVTDLGREIRDEPNATFVLEDGDYPLKTGLRFMDPGDGYDELQIIGKPHARIIPTEDVDCFGWFGRASGGAFSKLSLQNLTLVVGEGCDAGWGRFWIDDTVQNRNLSIEGQRSHRVLEGDKFGYFCCMTSPGGVGIHQNIDLPDGDIPSVQSDNTAIGVGVEDAHVGTNLWLGCYLENWWGNGFYVKDGTGSNILIGCEARNCGNANIRIGHSDAVLGCRSVWDDTRPPNEIRHGICFGADDASATTVSGLRIIKSDGGNDAARLWSETSDQISVNDLHILNETSQWAVSIRGDGNATAKFDNLRVLDSGDTSVRGASVQSKRWNVVLEDSVVDVSGGGSDRAAVDVQSGRCDLRGGSLAGAGNHSVRIQDGVSRVYLDGVDLVNGIYLYSGSEVGALELSNVDGRKVEPMWPGADPEDVCGDLNVSGAGLEPHPKPATPGVGVGESGRSVSWIEAEGERTPVYTLEGEQSGPTVAVVGGVHGDEDPGYRIAGRLASMHPQQGTLRVIPRANPKAIRRRSRGAGYDLNRAYPRGTGPETDLARALWDAVHDADAVLDLHRSGGIYPDGPGQAVFSTAECADKGERAVNEFNARYIDPGQYGRKYKLSHVPNQSSGSGINSLIRYCGSQGVAGHLIETTTQGIGMEDSVEWMGAIVHEVLWQHGVIVE